MRPPYIPAEQGLPGRLINLIAVHCSATPDGRWVSTLDIDHWHRDRGFRRGEAWRKRQNRDLAAIGYHYVIYTNGAIATGRHVDEVGAHARGRNANSLGICLVGSARFTPAQWASLASCVHALVRWVADRRRVQHELRQDGSAGALLELARRMGLAIVGHRDLSPDANGDGTVQPAEWLKTCPNFSVAEWLRAGLQPLDAHVFSPPKEMDHA